MLQSRLCSLALVLAIGGCTAAPPRDPILFPDPEIITLDEITASRGNSAYDVIKKVHANFLSYRGRTSIADSSGSMPMVFIDDQVFGPISVLRNIPASQIAEIRLYRAWEAVIKYGTGLPGGAISLKTRLEN